MRSLVEHHAIAVSLVARLGKSWEDIGKRAFSGSLDQEFVSQFERHLARFLSGTKGTEEPTTALRDGWVEKGMSNSLSLPSAIEIGLEHDEVLRHLYDYGSDVLHGRRVRGVELLPPTDSMFVTASLSRALMTLDQLCGRDASLNVAAGAELLRLRMEVLERALDGDGEDSSGPIHRALAHRGKLKLGRDYTGSGTREDPYIFIDELSYQDAFPRLCVQLSLDTIPSRSEISKPGWIMDVVQGEGREHYFLAKLPCC
jgi:hypothetical protein